MSTGTALLARGSGCTTAKPAKAMTWWRCCTATHRPPGSGGRLTIRVHGDQSVFFPVTDTMAHEVAEHVRVAAVPGSGHWMAEENPEGLAEILTRFDADVRTGATLDEVESHRGP